MKFKIEPQPYRPGASFLTLLEKEILQIQKDCIADDFCTGSHGTFVFARVRASLSRQNADF